MGSERGEYEDRWEWWSREEETMEDMAVGGILFLEEGLLLFLVNLEM